MLRGPDDEQHTEETTETKTEETVEEKTLVNEGGEQTEETKTEEKIEEETEEKKEEEVVETEPLKQEDLTVPEGLELQPELTNKFLEILNGEMDPKDRANALIALHSDTIRAASEASSEAWDKMQTEWKDAAKADPDIGGAKLQPTLTNIGKLLDEFGTKELRGVFDLTGAGNNPEMIKFLNKISSALTEGGHFTAKSPSGELTAEEKARRMYPSMSK